MADATLLIKVLADVSAAHTSFQSMGTALSAALGIGPVGTATAIMLDTSAKFESSMSKVQQAYNRVDFAPGTQNYTDATNTVLRMSTTLATNFEDVAASMAQAAKVTDEYGNKLPTSKVDEFVDANLRLKASSQDSIDALTSGQHMAMFDKMFSSQDYAGTGAAVAALTTQHPQSEETLWNAAIGIAQYGAPMGVTMAQALGIGNYLSDVGGGGMTGGASVGRMFLRMDTAADQVLDPQAKYNDVKKNRAAQERLDDLQNELKVAEAKHAEMYGQHGLKTQYQKHPSEVMAEEDRLARLRREIADQKENIAHENDPKAVGRGKMDIVEMAKTAGQTAEAYATLFKENPADALLAFTRGLHELPATQRGAAEVRAGIVQTKDQKTIDLLSDQPGSVERMIAIADEEYKNKTALNQISNIGLGTANAHLEDLHNAERAGVARAGMPTLAKADKGITDLLSLIEHGKWDELQKMFGDSASNLDKLNAALAMFQPVLSGVELVLGAALPGVLKNIFAGGKGPGAPGVPGAPPDWTPQDLERIRNGGLGQNPATAAGAGGMTAAIATGAAGALLAGGYAFVKIDEAKAQIDALNSARQSVGLQPITMNFGDIHPGQDSAEQIFEKIKGQFVSAWNTAMSGTPVSGPMGGAYNTGSAPR